MRINSGDFDFVRAPLASMEDLSVVNTPIPTPTAGQSPRTRCRWSHRSSSGMTLDNMLGPINELVEENQETKGITSHENNNDNQSVSDGKEINRSVGSTASLPLHTLNSHPLISTSPPYGSQQHPELIEITKENIPTNDDILLCNPTNVNQDERRIVFPFSSNGNPSSSSPDNSKNVNEAEYLFSVPKRKARAKNRDNVRNPTEKEEISNGKEDEVAPLVDIKDNIVGSSPIDTSEDPFSHIQWPKSSYQLDKNYSTAMPPPCAESSLKVPQKSADYYHVMNPCKQISYPRWRTCDVIPEEENMQILGPTCEYNQAYSNCTLDRNREMDNLLLRPRQVQFVSPKYRRKHFMQKQNFLGGSCENASISSSGVSSSQKIFGQQKERSPEMASLIRANDGSIDGARCHLEPKDRLFKFQCPSFFLAIFRDYVDHMIT